MGSLNDPKRQRRKVPLPRDMPRSVLPPTGGIAASVGGQSDPLIEGAERMLAAARARAVDDDLRAQMKGAPSGLVPQELPPNISKAGRRRNSVVGGEDGGEVVHGRRGSGALSSRSCGNEEDAPNGQKENDFTASLLKRLTDAERELKIAKSELLHKAATVEELKRKNQVLKARADGAASPIMVKRMEQDNQRLTKELKAMHKFLEDYGLKWVGDSAEASSDDVRAPSLPPEAPQDPEAWVPEASVPSASPPGADHPTEKAAKEDDDFAVEMALLSKHVAELNLVAGEGSSDVSKNKAGEFKLQKKEYMELTFWKNGFQIDGKPLRSYKVQLNRAFAQDLMDGYFPYELKEEFPDGVPFTVIDRTHEKHHRPFSQAGSGRQLGNKVGHSVTDVTANDAKTRANEGPVNVDNFLNKLPQNVIRNGRIVNVRAGVEEMVRGQAEPANQIYNIDATQEDNGESSVEKAADKSEKTTTLQIKSSESNKTFIMRFAYSATVAEVLRHLGKVGEIPSQCEEDGVLPQYQLQTTFPKQALQHTSMTLEQAGLVPNCALILVKLTS